MSQPPPLVALGLIALIACPAATPPPPAADTATDDSAVEDTRPNLIFVLLDDFGVDVFGPSGVAVTPAKMPTLERLAAEGTYFERAYAYATCSPTRAAWLTGRYGRRTGIGRTVNHDHTDELSIDEISLPRLTSDHRYPWHAVGKWHLASAWSPSGFNHPLALGFESYQGSFSNVNDYFSYTKVLRDGSDTLISGRYLTTDTIDDAITVATTATPPFGLYVSLHAPHAPWHTPPTTLQSTYVHSGDAPRLQYRAALEALDTELSRLLDALPPNSIVVVMGDNGTPGEVVAPPYNPNFAKSTLFELGVRVPLVVHGPGVSAAARTDAFVHVLDLYPTFADLIDVDVPHAIDGRSFAPLIADPTLRGPRDAIIVERFHPNGPPPYGNDDRAIRLGDYKLYRDDKDGDAFFHLVDGPQETSNLLNQPMSATDTAAFEQLSAELDAWIVEVSSP